MVNNVRKKPTENTNILLVGEVSGRCPKCDKLLMYSKGSTNNKKFEVAHIYPFSPTAVELNLLAGEERLSSDVDHIHNLIALCLDCHNEFDNPRTVEEYREMVALKRKIMDRSFQRGIADDYTIESEIISIISSLESIDGEFEELGLEPKRVDQKIDLTMSKLTKNRIKNNVSNYFLFVRQRFEALEKSSPETSILISAQVKAFYRKQAALLKSQQEIFKNIVGWIMVCSKSNSSEAAEIVASFFVQNCEVFDDISQ